MTHLASFGLERILVQYNRLENDVDELRELIEELEIPHDEADNLASYILEC